MDREQFLIEYTVVNARPKNDIEFDLDKLNTEAISHDTLHFNYGDKRIRGLTSLVILMEEMAELQQEVSKVIRGRGNKYGILEELADVTICLERLKLLLDLSDNEFYKALQVKMDRLKKRMDQEKKESERSIQRTKENFEQDFLTAIGMEKDELVEFLKSYPVSSVLESLGLSKEDLKGETDAKE